MSGHDQRVETELDRDIGIIGAVALGLGTMIAAGIFVLSGLAVSNVGAMAIVSFVIAAIVASFTAFAYAEFAAIYPESGGGYTYVANTFDSNLTYIVGWSMILGYPASAAFYLASFSTWFHEFIAPLFDIHAATPFWASGLVILGLLVLLNLKGTEESGQFQIAVTALKVALILVFLFGGLQAFNADVIRASIAEHIGMFREIGVTSALVFITFFGFEAIATNAEEIEDPGRTIPRAIFISMGLVTVIYALVVLVITLSLNNQAFMNTFLPTVADLGGQPAVEFIAANGEKAMAYAAEFYLGEVGFYVIIVGALFSMLSAANATILAGSRVKLAMSRRNQLPSRFEKLHDTLNTPHYAVLLTGGLIGFFIVFFTVIFGGPESESILHLPFTIPLVGNQIHLGVSAIAHFADFMLLTGLIVVNFAVIRSRKKYPDIDRSFEVPAVPYVPIVAILANLVLVVNVDPGSFLLGLLAQLVGVGLWFGLIRRGATGDIETEAPRVIAERSPAEREYEILVPIANPDHVPQLMRTARDIAADRGGHIHVLSVVKVPEQTPLTRGRERTDEQREVIERAMEIDVGGGDVEIPVDGTVRIAHHVDDAIHRAIRSSESDAVLMGWHGRSRRRRDRVLGSIVDEVVREVDCDVLVERMGGDSTPESILVPTAGGTHAGYAAEVVGSLARSTGASVEIVSVVDEDATPRQRRHAENTLERAEKLLGEDVEFTSELLESDEVVNAIIDRSADHDLTVVGATREGLFQQLIFGSIPEAVGSEADGTVIMAKRNLGIGSRLRSTLERLVGR